MTAKNLLHWTKRALKYLWENGAPGHIFSPMVLSAILTITFLAGFKVASFFELITHPGFPLVEVYLISLGGTVGLKFVKGRQAGNQNQL